MRFFGKNFVMELRCHAVRRNAFRPVAAIGIVCALAATPAPDAAATGATERPVSTQDSRGAAIAAGLRKGGLVMFFRHADTRGMPCDRSFRVGDRAGQRNISAAAQLPPV